MEHAIRYQNIKLKPEIGGMTLSVLLKAEEKIQTNYASDFVRLFNKTAERSLGLKGGRAKQTIIQ